MDEATNFYPSQTILTTTAYLIKNLEDSSYKEVLMRSDSPLRSCKVTQAIRAGLIAHRSVCCESHVTWSHGLTQTAGVQCGYQTV